MKQVDIFDLEHSDIEKMEDGSNLLTKPMEIVMSESMMPYAEHVILDRARRGRLEAGATPHTVQHVRTGQHPRQAHA